MGPDFYVYAADVYCEDCTEQIKERLKNEGHEPANPEDERSYDSDDWPKGPYSDEESDSPQHCGNHEHCLDPYVWPDGSKSGKFLENPLTTEGERNVKEMHREGPSEVTQMWMDHYGLTLALTVEQRRSKLRARLKELSNEDAFQIVDTLVMTVCDYLDDDGDLDGSSDLFDEMLSDLDNWGLDATRL